MGERVDLTAMDERIKAIKAAATELKSLSGDLEAVRRNADRILASVRMLEINVSDVVELVGGNEVGEV
jgi:hypothetical protein